MLKELRGRHVLLLQGPMGPFFRRLANELQGFGACVSKINLNAGDLFFYSGPNVHNFRGPLEEWPQFIRKFLRDNDIDVIFLFGDQRAYHRPILEIATTLGIRLYVFEEGYLRPNYITLELGGVNGRSSMPRRAESFDGMPSTRLVEPKNPMSAFYYGALYACTYHVVMSLGRWVFPHYQHHRQTNVLYQVLSWIKGIFRYYGFRFRERRVLDRLKGDTGRFFLVPLQVRDDAQVRVWSDYPSIEVFIEEVAVSFARSADPEDKLVFKHHPMDRAYSDYTALMRTLRAKTGLGDRLLYIHDVPMPKLLDHAKGVVCINSTSGISALHHNVPVRTLGNAIYNIPGLVSDAPLEDFWCTPGKVDGKLFVRFRNWLLLHNQLHGSFYQRLPEQQNPTGLMWNPVTLPSPVSRPETVEIRASGRAKPAASAADAAVEADAATVEST